MNNRIEITIPFGKIGYNSNRKINEITVEVALYYYNNGSIQFAASGRIWNGNHSNILTGGQNLDKIRKYKNLLDKPALFDEIYYYWKKFHLKETPRYIVKRVEDIIEGNFNLSVETHHAQIISLFEYGI